jgi:glycosyltransferase involved in cell wall biosynthesis
MMRIAFLGNMNNLGYVYAKALRKRGYEVTLFLDVDKSYFLDRPESWEGGELEGDTSWIIEPFYNNENALYRLTFPKLLLRKLLRKLDTYDVIFLNGKWTALGSFLKDSKKVFGLFAGYELDVLGDISTVKTLAADFYNSRYKKIKGLIPRSWVNAFYANYIHNHIRGIKRTDLLSYYAEGISPKGDELIKQIKSGQNYSRLQVRGFDTSHFPFAPKERTGEFVILNTTRFYFLEEREDNKRNDIMLHGIAKFIDDNKIQNTRLIFFEKGIDLAAAKQLCTELGLDKYIEWVKEVLLTELVAYYEQCDVAFDQLGNQWIGSGLFSMLTGRPLIANARNDIYQRFTHLPSPICHAEDPRAVADWLTKLYNDPELAKKIGIQSREYVLELYDLDKTIDFFIQHMN